ncbi:MoaD/ThiS family protein [Candidatus Mcinerneyibacteriota bacterium]|nr:MoaD/ThiS family protein [Candidatus Mcinerneyibacteriota bacterium]
MRIKVFAGMKQFFGQKEEVDLPLDEPCRVEELVEKLDLPEDLHFVVVRDGKSLGRDDIVSDNDRVSFVRFVSGG